MATFPGNPAASALTGAEIVPVTQGGVDSRTTTQDIADLAGLARNTVTAATSTANDLEIDYALGDYFTVALSENVSTWSFDNMPGSGFGATLAILLEQDSTPRTVAWPGSFDWGDGVTPPTMPTGSGDQLLLIITTFDNGTLWNATARELA